jgi:hypothetical protein
MSAANMGITSQINKFISTLETPAVFPLNPFRLQLGPIQHNVNNEGVCRWGHYGNALQVPTSCIPRALLMALNSKFMPTFPIRKHSQFHRSAGDLCYSVGYFILEKGPKSRLQRRPISRERDIGTTSAIINEII